MDERIPRLPAGRRWVTVPAPHVCAVSDVGLVRDHNEDGFHVSDDGSVLVVADGMGGHLAGEVASGLAVQALVEFVDAEARRAADSGARDVRALLSDAFQSAHERVHDAARARMEYRGMGTTLVAGYLRGNELYTCHVGDVRAYVRRATGLAQLTHDHSVVGRLMRAGELTAEVARVHPRRSEILQAVGLDAGIAPELNTATLAPGDLVLLCSDGLWEMLAEAEIASLLDSGESIPVRAHRLVDRAIEVGGHDNITVVLYEHAAARRGPG